MNDQIPHDEIVVNEPIVDEPHKVALKRSQRQNSLLLFMIMWFIYKS